MAHPVIAALRDRPPGARIALVIEGGGMRGAVSGAECDVSTTPRA